MNAPVPIDRRPLVVIGVPCGDRVHAEFMETIWGLGRGARNHRQGLIKAQSSIVAHGRNNCVAAAVELKAQYLFFADSDMTMPYNTIDRLLAHDKDIVCATYVRRGPPFDNMGHTLHEADKTATAGLVEMTHAPTGCMLIKMSVFDKLKKPFFRYETNEEIGDVRGEDFVFSEMTRAAGLRLWCDIDLSKEVGHMYQYVLRAEDPTTRAAAERFKEAING